MTKAQLLELIGNGENSGVDFKRDDLGPESLAKEIVALANFRGGRILLGVEDDGTITGIQRHDLEHWLMDTVFGHVVHPMILPFYEEVQVGEGLRVAVVTVSQGVAKPYVVRRRGREDVYVRVGSTSRLASREQLARLFANGGLLRTELLPVSGSSLRDFSLERLSHYLVRIVGEDVAPVTEQSWEERLCALGFMVDRPGGAPVCTIAGLVLFGRAHRLLLPNSGVRWMSFGGKDKDYRAQDDRLVNGPLVALFGGPSSGVGTRVENGLIENLVDAMRPFVSRDDIEPDAGMRRRRLWEYPSDALREGILNALAHRDWTRNEETEIVRYSDRLEISSPGALQNSMTVEKMLAGQRSARNPLIVEVLRDYGYVDARGMGVRKKIVPLLQENNGTRPEYTATEDYVKLVMYRAPR